MKTLVPRIEDQGGAWSGHVLLLGEVLGHCHAAYTPLTSHDTTHSQCVDAFLRVGGQKFREASSLPQGYTATESRRGGASLCTFRSYNLVPNAVAKFVRGSLGPAVLADLMIKRHIDLSLLTFWRLGGSKHSSNIVFSSVKLLKIVS